MMIMVMNDKAFVMITFVICSICVGSRLGCCICHKSYSKPELPTVLVKHWVDYWTAEALWSYRFWSVCNTVNNNNTTVVLRLLILTHCILLRTL